MSETFEFVLVAQSAFTSLAIDALPEWINELEVEWVGFGCTTDQGQSTLMVRGTMEKFRELSERGVLGARPITCAPDRTEGWLAAMNVNGQIMYINRPPPPAIPTLD